MGINGLLPVLKSICDARSIATFAGLRVGVDASSWLHRGAFACALELATGAPTRRYVDYCMHRVRLLLHHGAVPVLVFDGAPLPMKAGTNARRREARARARAAGEAALARRPPDRAAAQDAFQKACEVTHEMARALIKEVRKLNVEYVVAPYEADAQLAWLSATGDVDVVVTEDSDLVVYGARKIFYKMTKDGDGDLYLAKNLAALDSPSMRNFTPQMFTWVCVLAGCDFFDGVAGLGIRKAHALVKKYPSIRRALQVILYDTRYKVAADFGDHFHRACLVFRHQTVFDRATGANQHLNILGDEARAGIPEHIFRPSPDAGEDLDFIGRFHDDAVAVAVSNATVHPVTLVQYLDPLDAVERPVPSSRTGAAARMRSFFRGAPSRARGGDEAGGAASAGGLQVSRAGGGRAFSRSPAYQATPRPVARPGAFFSGAKTRPPPHIGHSPAVASVFKAPVRSAGTGGAGAASGAPPSPGGVASGARNAWANRSLSMLNPGNVPLASGKRRSALGAAGPGVDRSGKRQRTMAEVTKAAAASKATSRFADASRATRTITPHTPTGGDERAAGGRQTAPDVQPAALHGSDASVDENAGHAHDNCPSSPDSDAYTMFAAVDAELAKAPSESPATPGESPVTPGVAWAGREGPAHQRAFRKTAAGAEGASPLGASDRRALPRLRRRPPGSAGPTRAVMAEVRSVPRRSPRRKGRASALAAIDGLRRGAGASSHVVTPRPDL